MTSENSVAHHNVQQTLIVLLITMKPA